MTRGVSVVLLGLVASPLMAGEQELKTVTTATEIVQHFSTMPLHSIPAHLLHEAAGVVVLPHVVKAGLIVDGQFGRGVALVRQPDGSWSNPAFVTMRGLGLGGQAGVEAIDLVLVFKTRHSLDRVLFGKGKLTLGGDVAIAAGPVGREAELATDTHLKAEILSYSRSRGLFVGVSLEGASLHFDRAASESFYGVPGGAPATGLTHPCIEAINALRAELLRVSTPPPPPVAPPPSAPGPRGAWER